MAVHGNESGRANRVAPDGSLHAVAARGDFWGNRGPLLNSRGEPSRHFSGKLWIICALEFNGRHRTQWQPGRLTELYFLDEATGLAAGHRPCGECRHAAYSEFKNAWQRAYPQLDSSAGGINAAMHDSRLDGRTHRTHTAASASLPDGTMIEYDDHFWLLWGDHALRWTFDGYTDAVRRSALPAEVIVRTPAATVDVLAEGYRPAVHTSARDLLG